MVVSFDVHASQLTRAGGGAPTHAGGWVRRSLRHAGGWKVLVVSFDVHARQHGGGWGGLVSKLRLSRAPRGWMVSVGGTGTASFDVHAHQLTRVGGW